MLTIKKILLGLAFSILLSSCSSQGQDESSIRIAYLQNDLHHLPVFVALEKGFFEEEGLSVTVAGIFRAGPEQMSAFAAGDLDIGFVGQAPATAAVLNGVADLKFLAQVNLEGSSIVSRAGLNCNKINCLSGKTIAVPGHATMQDFLLRKAIQEQGLDWNKIKTIILKPPEMIQALSLGNIDAFIAWEPYPSQAVIKGEGKRIFSSAQIWEDHPCCVMVADRKFCSTNPDKIKKFIKVHKRSCKFINENQASAVAVGMKYTGMDRKAVAMALSMIKFSPLLDLTKGAQFVDFLRDLRYIKTGNMDYERRLREVYYFTKPRPAVGRPE